MKSSRYGFHVGLILSNYNVLPSFNDNFEVDVTYSNQMNGWCIVHLG